MSEKSHYHERIHRATQQLAQLQAKELLARQREANKEKKKQRRKEAQRRQRLAELVFLAGVEALEDDELLGALLLHSEYRKDSAIRTAAKERGASALAFKLNFLNVH